MQNLLLDIIFPQHCCSICRKPGRFGTKSPWCKQCTEGMQELKQSSPICDKCGKYINGPNSFCADCSSEEPIFHIARAVGPYNDSFRIAIKVLKFLGRRFLSVRMGQMMAETVLAEQRFWPLDLIIPVPASKGHLEQRGFNQTELLANQIAKKIKVKMAADILKRVKETPSQRELSKPEREKNLLCAFEVCDSRRISGKNILLVDDVYTTGSTSKECTRTLLEAGAAKVSVITWATGCGF
ncbi:MAG TPA: ComF family protein [Syntrophomonadaceae bacterium]|nr:ComF family protein [Syntrophomonadaceae bacterium]HRX20841.1 ComF family protein [Syntrophomonadaceae bacterium]